MDLRKFRRASVEYPVSFSGDGLNGEGVTYNLSTQGCAVRGNVQIPPGAYLALSIQLPGSPTPLTVEMAAVRWARSSEFGADFVTMREAERERLRRTLGALERAATTPPGSPG